MPYEIKFDNRPAGISLEAVPRGSGTVKVQTVEFVSEEDGDILVSRLEGFGSNILDRLPLDEPIPPSRVQHLLAIIRRDNTAKVYLNELTTIGHVQPKRGFGKGDSVFADDIADIHRLEFEGVDIPNDAGIVYIFAVGWRLAMFYDLAPLAPNHEKDREYDLGTLLGQYYAYLMFQSRFKITEDVWQNLLDGQWFPFVALKDATIQNLVAQAKCSWPLDDLSEPIAGEVKEAIPFMQARWKSTPAFADHQEFLQQAVERYIAKDYLSATALLYPRIEGILRSHQKLTDPGGQATQKGLAGSAVKLSETQRHTSTPLLPARFREYLENVYFASFKPNDSKIKVSRNSIGHGVAASDECSLKAATISILLVDQLYYLATNLSSKVANVTPGLSQSGEKCQPAI